MKKTHGESTWDGHRAKGDGGEISSQQRLKTQLRPGTDAKQAHGMTKAATSSKGRMKQPRGQAGSKMATKQAKKQKRYEEEREAINQMMF